MAIFFVAYSLHDAARQYQSLFAELEGLSALKAQRSLWLVDYDASARELRNRLVRHLDEHDELFVDRLSPDWTSWGMQTCQEWVRGRRKRVVPAPNQGGGPAH
jgi:hypothetical protein